jgi:hypothetical protein
MGIYTSVVRWQKRREGPGRGDDPFASARDGGLTEPEGTRAGPPRASGLDQRLDEAVEQCHAGQGGSALVSAENGILAHLDRFADDEPFTIDMARALSRHAEVLHRFGDPDLAVAAADLALRTFMNRRDEINRTANAKRIHVPAFVRAGLIAADIHERFGRHSIAASAKRLAMEAAPASPGVEFERPVPLLADMTVALALDRVPPPAGTGPAPAVLGEIKSSVTAPATDCSLIASSQRCMDEDAMVIAEIFAKCAEVTLEDDPAAGLRLGLESHVVYARQSERQTPEMRYNMGEHGPTWARTLVLCSQTCERHQLRDLALDLASWMGGVVNALVPFAFIDDEVRSVMRTCLTWHVELLTEAGESQGAAEAAQVLQTIEGLG